MFHRASIRGRMPPPFRGGSLSSSRIFLYRHYGSRIVGGNPRKTKEFKECGDVPPPRFFMFHPPLCPWNKKHAVLWNMKNTPNRRSFLLPPAGFILPLLNGLLGMSNSRQSRPLPQALLREVFAAPCTASRPRPSRRTVPEIPCLDGRLHH